MREPRRRTPPAGALARAAGNLEVRQGGGDRVGRRVAREPVLGGQGLHGEAAGDGLQACLARVLVPGGSGAPCTGIQPNSPAAPPTPRRTWPLMTVARPSPVPSQTNAKSSSPAATPSARSAIAARFTSFSITTGVCSTSRSASSTPSCQVGRFTASRGAPVLGSRTPGLPITTDGQVLQADPGALAGPPDRFADHPHRVVGAVGIHATSATRCPVTSATAALTKSGSTYSPAT